MYKFGLYALLGMAVMLQSLSAQDKTHPSETGLMIASLQEGQYSTWITLSNGSIWRYNDKGGFQNAWFIGDKVELRPTKSSQVWLLFNKSYSSSYPVTLEEMGSTLPRLVEIEKEGLLLQLSDGIVWNVDWWDAVLKETRHWSVGDTLLVVPSARKEGEGFVIINPNRNMDYVHARPSDSEPKPEEPDSKGSVGKGRKGA